MVLPEIKNGQPQGLFDNELVMSAHQALREASKSGEIRDIIRRIEQAGPIMVIDPEKAAGDLDDTLKRVRIAARNGMKVMEVGGSTVAGNEAETVIPQIREAVREAEGDTLLISFPGTSSQVVSGVDATFSLFLPQLDSVFRESSQSAPPLINEYLNVIIRSRELGVPVIPVIYILFSSGRKTSVEKATGIDAIGVRGGVDIEQVMRTINPWLKPNDLVMLELGSGPETFVNLGPLARKVYETTQIPPIVTGGVETPGHIAEITRDFPFPVVFGSVAEETPPDQFEELYKSFREAHPSCQEV